MKRRIFDFFKRNIKCIIIYLVIIAIMLIEFPYYIDAPGGIINVEKRISIENNYDSEGSFNLAYVSEYKATLVTLLFSLFNSDWKVISAKEVLNDNESTSDYELRDRLLMEEAYSNAILVGYTRANKNIDIIDEMLYVSYTFDESDTNLEIGDQILEVDDQKVHSKEEIDSIISNYEIGDTISIKVKKNDKEFLRTATLIDYNGKPIVGISVIKIRNLKTDPEIELNYKARESGSSCGLMLSLAIYNSLVEEDITNGLTIVGTGTIDENGNVGSIGGVEYKLKSAVKSEADLFIVPAGENYNDAIKLKKEKNYDIEIVAVSTFDEALEYLKNRE